MFKIFERKQSLSASLLEAYKSVTPTALGHILENGFMDGGLKPIYDRCSVVGCAVTVKTYGRDSTVCHKVIDLIQPGDVIVIDRGGDQRYACWGEMTSLAAKLRHAAGVVVDGPVTDINAMREIGLPVFCRGVVALTTQILGLGGEINTSIQCGGVVVHPGDLILADENGILVINPSEAEQVLHKALEEEQADREFKQGLLEGKLPSQLMLIDEMIQNVLARERKNHAF